MARLRTLAVLIATLAPLTAVAAEQAKRPFTIDLPAGCAVAGPQEGPDFDVYSVRCGADAEIGLYIGGYPNVDPDREGLVLKPDIPGRTAIVSAKDANELHGYLWRVAGSELKMHIWFGAGRENDPVARALAASVRPASAAR